MKVSYTVMAHPKRAVQAKALAGLVGARIAWDTNDDEWTTGARAIGMHDGDATHHVVLQDDAVPVFDFRHHASCAIRQHPDEPISFYLGRGRPKDAQRRIIRGTLTADEHGAAWLEADRLFHGVAIALPVADIPPLLEWCRRPNLPYDERIGAWYRMQQRRILYTWPSLVDHADEGTLVQHHDGQPRTEQRVAWRHGTPATWKTDIIPM